MHPDAREGFHHTVVITTKDRPDSLLTTLRSIERHLERTGRAGVDVIVVNDSDEARRAAYGFLRTYQSPNLNVTHVTMDEASKTLARAGLGGFVLKKWETDYGRPRNAGLFLALERAAASRANLDQTLVTFLDDDVRVARARVDPLGRPVYSAPSFDYFGTLERAFSDHSVGLAGEGYGFDAFSYAITSVNLNLQAAKAFLRYFVELPGPQHPHFKTAKFFASRTRRTWWTDVTRGSGPATARESKRSPPGTACAAAT